MKCKDTVHGNMGYFYMIEMVICSVLLEYYTLQTYDDDTKAPPYPGRTRHECLNISLLFNLKKNNIKKLMNE